MRGEVNNKDFRDSLRRRIPADSSRWVGGLCDYIDGLEQRLLFARVGSIVTCAVVVFTFAVLWRFAR